jgi:hypothetical protein
VKGSLEKLSRYLKSLAHDKRDVEKTFTYSSSYLVHCPGQVKAGFLVPSNHPPVGNLQSSAQRLDLYFTLFS